MLGVALGLLCLASAETILPGVCPLFYCVDPTTINSTDVFCARKDADGRIGLYQECPANYFCSIRELYADFLQTTQLNIDCRTNKTENLETYFLPLMLDTTFEWNCINSVAKELAYGQHPKTCFTSNDCLHADGSLGECICGIQSVFHSGYCVPDRLSKTFDMLWEPCPTGLVEDDTTKLYLQRYWQYYVYTQVVSVTCARTLFYENVQVWDAAALVVLSEARALSPFWLLLAASLGFLA